MRSLILATLAVGTLGLPSDARDVGQGPAITELKRQAQGRFRFVDSGTNHRITVWFCRGSTIAADTRVVFIMHGSESQTARQACDIASPYIQKHNVVVLVPQFAEEFYPGDGYVFGNMVDADGRLLPKSAWAFSTIERLFDNVPP